MTKRHIDLNKKHILITGSPGFIGSNLAEKLLEQISEGIIVSFD